MLLICASNFLSKPLPYFTPDKWIQKVWQPLMCGWHNLDRLSNFTRTTLTHYSIQHTVECCILHIKFQMIMAVTQCCAHAQLFCMFLELSDFDSQEIVKSLVLYSICVKDVTLKIIIWCSLVRNLEGVACSGPLISFRLLYLK